MKHFFQRDRSIKIDPAGLGAIIGVSVMSSIFIGMRICDYYAKQKQKQLLRSKAKHTPIPTPSLQGKKQSMKRQWKMKDLKLPQSFVLDNLSIRKF
jgi:hypothetical protein